MCIGLFSFQGHKISNPIKHLRVNRLIMTKTDISVRELVDKAQRGELKIPEMQRKFVWPDTRIRDLLDSLYRSYPSGTILVWETDEDVEDRDLAVKSTKSPITSQKLFLLDGQQRVTSLSAILSGEPVEVRNRKRLIEILFNLDHPDGPPVEVTEVDENSNMDDLDDNEETESNERDIQEEMKKRTFVVASRALKSNPVWISVSDVFKKTDSQILKTMGINSDNEKWDKYSTRLQNLRKIESYSYVMQVLDKNMTYEEVTEIFVRVNSLGIKLRSSDLALAQITTRWKGFMKLIEELAKEMGDNEEFVMTSGLPVRLLVIFATKQSRFRTVGKISKEKLVESWKLAISGLKFAINFLQSNAKIDDLYLISSPFLLIPIAVYAVNNERISPENSKKLLKWFYLAHMRGHYSMGSSESHLDLDLSILFKSNNLGELISQLQSHIKKFNVDPDDIIARGKRSPFFTMMYFVLKQKGAKDWFSGLSLSDKHIGKSFKLQHHHIFPKSILKNKNFDTREINEMANFAFIGGKTNRTITNKEPKMYFEDIIKNQGIDALTSQLIPIERDLWNIQNYEKFLQYRREKIAEEITEFMKQFE